MTKQSDEVLIKELERPVGDFTTSPDMLQTLHDVAIARLRQLTSAQVVAGEQISYEQLVRAAHIYQQRTGQTLEDALAGKWTNPPPLPATVPDLTVTVSTEDGEPEVWLDFKPNNTTAVASIRLEKLIETYANTRAQIIPQVLRLWGDNQITRMGFALTLTAGSL